MRIYSDISGKIHGNYCYFNFTGEHPALGSVNVAASGMITKELSDAEISGSEQKLKSLATLTSATLILNSNNIEDGISKWLEQNNAQSNFDLPEQSMVVKDFYYMFSYWWFAFIPLCLVGEVLVRRWHLLR
jgi:hypothetical protein